MIEERDYTAVRKKQYCGITGHLCLCRTGTQIYWRRAYTLLPEKNYKAAYVRRHNTCLQGEKILIFWHRCFFWAYVLCSDRTITRRREPTRAWTYFVIGYLPRTGIPGNFGAKIRYILKPSTNHTPGALRLASLTSYLFLALNGQVHLVLSILSSFQLLLAKFELIRGHTLVPRHVL